MESLVDKGEVWLEPLLAFRDYLASTNDPARKREFREIRGRDGRGCANVLDERIMASGNATPHERGGPKRSTCSPGLDGARSPDNDVLRSDRRRDGR